MHHEVASCTQMLSQKLLQQNLAGLSASGTFEEAVHSLNAAVHLLTARATGAGWRVIGDEPRRVA